MSLPLPPRQCMSTGLATNIESLKSELIILADLSGTSVQEFQRLSTAFKTLNIPADKTADILKDINDKVGDFILTGGGEFKDVFEKILTPLGKTRLELAELGPGGILLAVADGLEKIGANGQETTFALEALANDASLLLPLLKNNGEALNDISLQIENKGLLLTDDEVEALRKANVELSKIDTLFSNVFIKSKGVLAEFLFGDDFPETIQGINTEIDTLTAKLRNLQDDDSVFGFDDKEILQTQIRIGDLIAARGKLLSVERKAREESIQAAATEEVGQQRRLAEFEAERKAEEEKRKIRQEAEEQKLTDALTKQAEFESRMQERLERELELEQSSAQTRLDLILKLNDTERQGIEKKRLERLKDLQSDFDRRLILEEDFQKARAEIEKNARTANEKLDEKASKAKELQTEEVIDKVIGLMQSGNQELFRIGQAAALANAVVDTASAISKALGSAPPPISFLLATAASLAGAAQIAAIASASPPSARQQGGQFQPGQRLLVGEQGPEIVEFGAGGRIADARETSRITRDKPLVPEIIIINQTSNEIAEPDVNVDDDQKIVIMIRNTVSSDLEDPNSKVSKSLGRFTSAARQF